MLFAAILWASLPAMLRQNSSSHLACGTISAHLHICTFAQKNVLQNALVAAYPTTYLLHRIQKNQSTRCPFMGLKTPRYLCQNSSSYLADRMQKN